MQTLSTGVPAGLQARSSTRFVVPFTLSLRVVVVTEESWTRKILFYFEKNIQFYYSNCYSHSKGYQKKNGRTLIFYCTDRNMILTTDAGSSPSNTVSGFSTGLGVSSNSCTEALTVSTRVTSTSVSHTSIIVLGWVNLCKIEYRCL